MTLAGKRLHIAYENGLELDAEYVGDSELRWTATAGPPAGTSGQETVRLLEVAPDVYFINWLERSGTSISQVVDLNTSRVATFVTFDTGEGRASAYQHGTVRLI